MLLDSEPVYARAGYCLALARFGEDEDAVILSSYLDRYQPQVENRYDEKLATDHADRFLTPRWAVGDLLAGRPGRERLSAPWRSGARSPRAP